MYPVGWLSDEDLLVLYRDDFFDNGKPGVINLITGGLIPLLGTDQIQMIEGQGFDEVALSPDRKWLAFSEVMEPFSSSKLWLMELNLR